MRKTLSTFSLALVLVCAQALYAPVSQSQPQPAPEDLLLAAAESGGANLDAIPGSSSGVQVPASPPDNNEASELGGDNRQQGGIGNESTNQDNNLAPPPGSGQSNSEASES